jgi:hypothetical protein
MPSTVVDEPQTRDSIRNADQPTSSGSWLWLGIGSILLLFSYGANNVALAAWLAPVFLLRFVRRRSWRVWVPNSLRCRNRGVCVSISRDDPYSGCWLLHFACSHGYPDANSLRVGPLARSTNWGCHVHSGFPVRMDCSGLLKFIRPIWELGSRGILAIR